MNGLTRLGKIQPIIDYVYLITLLMYLKVISVKVILAGLLLLGFMSGIQAATLQTYASGNATPTTIASFAMTDFVPTGATTGTTTSVASPISGLLSFKQQNGDPASMLLSTANAATEAATDVGATNTWWQNGESSDYDVYLTTTLSWVTILMPANTRAFSFNVGANKNATGWFSATESTGSGIVKTDFGVSPSNTPGYGIYADKGSCSVITSVTIDPTFIWGFGNFSINQDTCTSVPESNSIYLLALGLFGLLLTARRKS